MSKSYKDGLTGFAIITGDTIRYAGWTGISDHDDALAILENREAVKVTSARQMVSSLQQNRDPRTGAPIGMSKFVAFVSPDMAVDPVDITIVPTSICLISENEHLLEAVNDLLQQAEDRERGSQEAHPAAAPEPNLVVPFNSMPNRRH